MSLVNGELVVVRGAGDLATGVIARLTRAGFGVLALETARPSAIRRTVCLSEAVYEGAAQVEEIQAIRVASVQEAKALLGSGPGAPVPVLVDPDCFSLAGLRPLALVDAIIAKRNLGTRMDLAPLVVALGPGFTAGVDAHAVVETNRGHDLGRVLLQGSAEPNTGIPGLIQGAGRERVLHAPAAGLVENLKAIGELVQAGEPVLAIQGEAGRVTLHATLDGSLRGLIRPGFQAHAGLKVADIDPRCRRGHCFTISDKAMAIAGGVLEAILRLGVRP